MCAIVKKDVTSGKRELLLLFEIASKKQNVKHALKKLGGTLSHAKIVAVVTNISWKRRSERNKCVILVFFFLVSNE